jgi:hypothetical protein
MATFNKYCERYELCRDDEKCFSQCDSCYSWETRVKEIRKEEKKYTDDEVIQLIDNFRNSHETDLIKWFNLNKKK